MADARVYKLAPGVTVEMIGQALEGYLRERKRLEVEGISDPEGGYFIQARQVEDWKKFVGLDQAVQVKLTPYGGTVAVDVGAGRWIDKIGVATVGYLLFAPLMLTAAIGALGQGQLPADIFGFVERFALMGGRPMDSNDIGGGGTGFADCQGCGASVPRGARFCPQCGAPVSKPRACPGCNAPVPEGARFCVSCGEPVDEQK